LIPHSSLLRIPKCGHSSALEAPDTVSAAILELLEAATTSPTDSGV